eukprot:sb/3477231/
MTRIMAMGKKYEIADFSVKVGSVLLGGSASFRCMVLEIEYRPSCYAKDAAALLHEFLSIVTATMPIGIPENLNHFADTISGLYQLSDTIKQYVKIFTDCRRVANSMGMLA